MPTLTGYESLDSDAVPHQPQSQSTSWIKGVNRMYLMLPLAGLVLLVFLRAESHAQIPINRATSAVGEEVVERNALGCEKEVNMYKRPKHDRVIIHISDTHVDPWFTPDESMQPGVCHTCRMSNAAYGEEAECPKDIPEMGQTHAKYSQIRGYPFGRYKCNPPLRLLQSVIKGIKKIDEHPKVIVFTGDVAPHGMPDDNAKLTNTTKLSDLCDTKMQVFRNQVRFLRKNFPKSVFAYTMGNNDHFPKNTFWAPWIKALGQMLYEEGWLDKKQAEDFKEYGSAYYDVDGIRYLGLDLTLFTPGGETHLDTELVDIDNTVRAKTVQWVEKVLKDAKKNKLAVYLVGHQPLTTKKGKDELDIEGLHYSLFKDLLAQYSPDTIKMAMFGHRNLAGIQPVLDLSGNPIIPSLTAPGISPRGGNEPTFMVHFYNEDKVVEDFEQWNFKLAEENARAKHKHADWLGEWKMHSRDLFSWAAISGGKAFTVENLMHVLVDHVSTDESLFFKVQMFKKGGYVGDETPENYRCKALYDTNDMMMKCLFSKQDPKCWNPAWIA